MPCPGAGAHPDDQLMLGGVSAELLDHWEHRRTTPVDQALGADLDQFARGRIGHTTPSSVTRCSANEPATFLRRSSFSGV